MQSYALDAIDWFDPNKETETSIPDVTTSLADTMQAAMESRPSVALGTDIRVESEKVTGFALVHEEELLHLSVFLQKGKTSSKTHKTRMARFSGRRRSRE